MSTFENIIKEYIENACKSDEVLAGKYEKSGKDIAGCCKYIKAEAKKKAKNGCAVIADAEVFEEGSELCHCVFTNNYYKHPDCLIIGARVDGKRTETIEIDTKNWKVVQCRGKHNQPSKYHERILRLMNKNMDKFRRVAL